MCTNKNDKNDKNHKDHLSMEEHIERATKACEALKEVVEAETKCTEKVYEHEQPRPENVLMHPSRSQSDLPITDILRGAADADLVELLVVGVRKDGREFLSTSMASVPVTLYNLERAARRLHAIMDERQEDLYGIGPDEGPDVA